MSVKPRVKSRRAYRPEVEALEALRLPSGVAGSPLDLAAEHEAYALSIDSLDPTPPPQAPPSDSTWDAALVGARVDDLLGPGFDRPGALADAEPESEAEVDAEDLSAGLVQLDKYLARSWFRAGISPQQHDDCTQAVYASLLQSFGRDRFDRLLAEVGHFGIRDVLSRETADGPDFFRAIDTVKKRAQRERSFQPLDAVDAPSTSRPGDSSDDRRAIIQEAIRMTLSPREAALIQATLQGETPAEIAQQWGIAPKTVSNEKTRAFQKLRDALGSDVD